MFNIILKDKYIYGTWGIVSEEYPHYSSTSETCHSNDVDGKDVPKEEVHDIGDAFKRIIHNVCFVVYKFPFQIVK